jgi:hypothetical protein
VTYWTVLTKLPSFDLTGKMSASLRAGWVIWRGLVLCDGTRCWCGVGWLERRPVPHNKEAIIAKGRLSSQWMMHLCLVYGSVWRGNLIQADTCACVHVWHSKPSTNFPKIASEGSIAIFEKNSKFWKIQRGEYYFSTNPKGGVLLFLVFWRRWGLVWRVWAWLLNASLLIWNVYGAFKYWKTDPN